MLDAPQSPGDHAREIGQSSTATAPHELGGALLHTVTSRVTNPPLELVTTDEAFQPNPTTVRFARCVRIDPGDVVFDIGTGIGPLALMAGRAGAKRVIGVDPVQIHCQLAQLNATRCELNQTVRFYRGCFFEPFEREAELAGLKANVVIGDVSGIADAVAHALGWYSSKVPTGGYDGTEVIRDFLRQVPRYLVKGGRVYFPIACDLSDGPRVVEEAKRLFAQVDNALKRPYVEFPLAVEDVQTIHDAYAGKLPPFIQIQHGKRPFWRGQILVASQPRDHTETPTQQTQEAQEDQE